MSGVWGLGRWAGLRTVPTAAAATSGPGAGPVGLEGGPGEQGVLGTRPGARWAGGGGARRKLGGKSEASGNPGTPSWGKSGLGLEPDQGLGGLRLYFPGEGPGDSGGLEGGHWRPAPGYWVVVPGVEPEVAKRGGTWRVGNLEVVIGRRVVWETLGREQI